MDPVVLHRYTSVASQAAVVLTIDVLLFIAVVRVSRKWAWYVRWPIWLGFWCITLFAIGCIAWYYLADIFYNRVGLRQWIISTILILYGSKLFAVFFIVLDELRYRVLQLWQYVKKRKSVAPCPQVEGKVENPVPPVGGPVITRSQFLAKTALAAAAVPFATSVFGIIHGAYDYHIRRRTIYLPNLPKAFDGIRIGQISDIHSNPNYHKVSVQGGVDMLMQEKADVLFFTGDLVNFRTNEAFGFMHIFEQLKAPLGVYSVTGNHDYGEYLWWPSEAAREQNFEDFKAVHKKLGYDLLLNEHRFLELDGEKIAIIGVENWGTGRFPKYGKLGLAYPGTEEAPVKLLLSHDPSHWDVRVRPGYPDIDVTFAGHTHGFQLGVQIGDFRWSPAQYRYKQWADLYREGNQYLYVNRGFGCIGYLGRIGMPPELTIVELKRGEAPRT